MSRIPATPTPSETPPGREWNTNIRTGLTTKEAQTRLSKYGFNQLDTYKTESLWRIFLAQFISPLVWVLVFAAGLAFLFQEWLEGVAIIAVILINAGIGFFMEKQAIKSMEALRQLAQTYAHVIRDQALQKINATLLVPGDVIYVEAGNMVPADARLVEIHNLAVSEAALTGESAPVSKTIQTIHSDAVLAEQKDRIFKGTVVSRGNGKAIITQTGKYTELGRIATLTREASKEITPLEKKLGTLSQKLLWLTLVLAFLVLVIGLVQGREMFLMIETAIALAIAAIPEGLPIVATIALAKGMLRLANNKVIVKKLSAVETLGQTEVIFTDKTGTLTENKLHVDTVLFGFDRATFSYSEQEQRISDAKKTYLQETFAYSQLQKVSALCNNASLAGRENKAPVGDPLEIALMRFVEQGPLDLENLQKEYPRIKEIPFDSSTKMMGTLHKNNEGAGYLVCIKGALEVILKESDFVLTREGKKPLTDPKFWLEQTNHLAVKGLRILAFAYSEIVEPKDDFSHHLIFIGCIGFIDPPRKEVKAAIQNCRKAGIQVIMVTGDHPGTSKNIALKTGLIDHDAEMAIHGRDLAGIAQFSPEEKTKLFQTKIFARVSPEQKLELVRRYQEDGKIVGMTGDGVNDTPALKKADIGIAMGQRGTEAAKEVADLILENDAFTSIVVAIEQGRGIFANIRYFVIYLLSCNLSELLVVAAAFFSNLTLPLFPLQILFINMVTDVFPALALGMNQGADKVMEQPPRGKNEPILTSKAWISVMGYALSITLPTIGALLFATYYLKLSAQLSNNFSFYTLILAQLWHVFNLPPANVSFFHNVVTRNKYIWSAIIICISILAIAYSIPIMKEVLNLGTFNFYYMSLVIGFSLLPVLLVQVLKRLGWIS